MLISLDQGCCLCASLVPGMFVQKYVVYLSPTSLSSSLSITQVCGAVEVKKVMYITAEKLTYKFCHSPLYIRLKRADSTLLRGKGTWSGPVMVFIAPGLRGKARCFHFQAGAVGGV